MKPAYTFNAPRYEFDEPFHEGVDGHLTPRQLEVLALLCAGLSNKLICRQLNISPSTCKVHISSILRELGVTSRVQAVVRAHRSGIVAGSPMRSPAQPAANPA